MGFDHVEPRHLKDFDHGAPRHLRKGGVVYLTLIKSVMYSYLGLTYKEHTKNLIFT